MKKLLIPSAITALLLLNGCQAVQDQAESLRKQSEDTVNNFSQQAEGLKTQVIQTKQKFDEKSQQVINTVDAVNKLTN